MRTVDIALTALAVRTARPEAPATPRPVLSALDDAGHALLDRAAIAHDKAALIASLWPPARPCAVRSVFAELPAPAVFGMAFQVSWGEAPRADARALQARLRAAFASK